MIPKRWLLPIALAVGVLQIGFLATMIAGRASVLRSGTEVTLEVRPVDPRDLLRGDYVVLTYNISRIPASLLGEGPLPPEGDSDRAIVVRLKAGDDGLWQPVSAHFDEAPPQPAGDGEVDIRGVVRSSWSSQASSLDIRYGIERFYVPEGEGRAIERDMNVRPFRMKVAVADDGTAQIKSFHDGETMLYAEPLY